jgi:hypothetical protein
VPSNGGLRYIPSELRTHPLSTGASAIPRCLCGAPRLPRADITESIPEHQTQFPRMSGRLTILSGIKPALGAMPRFTAFCTL